MLNFVVCDDNITVLNRLCKMLEAILIKNNIDGNIVLQTDNANTVLSFIEKNPVNVLLLDINLKGDMSGLELAQKVRAKSKSAYIIFSTGHLEYAMIAYKVKTFDFLAKPITQERLEETILRLVNDISCSPKRYIKLGKGNRFINLDEINFIKKDGMKLMFYTNNNVYTTYNSFSKIESCLSENFIRCHKSYIVNTEKISKINSKNLIQFNDNLCEIGPKYKNKLMEVLKNGIFTNDME